MSVTTTDCKLQDLVKPQSETVTKGGSHHRKNVGSRKPLHSHHKHTHKPPRLSHKKRSTKREHSSSSKRDASPPSASPKKREHEKREPSDDKSEQKQSCEHKSDSKQSSESKSNQKQPSDHKSDSKQPSDHKSESKSPSEKSSDEKQSKSPTDSRKSHSKSESKTNKGSPLKSPSDSRKSHSDNDCQNKGSPLKSPSDSRKSHSKSDLQNKGSSVKSPTDSRKSHSKSDVRQNKGSSSKDREIIIIKREVCDKKRSPRKKEEQKQCKKEERQEDRQHKREENKEERQHKREVKREEDEEERQYKREEDKEERQHKREVKREEKKEDRKEERQEHRRYERAVEASEKYARYERELAEREEKKEQCDRPIKRGQAILVKQCDEEAHELKVKYYTDTVWSLTKVPVINQTMGMVNWTLTADHQPETDAMLRLEGDFTIENKSKWPAMLGNMVSNLESKIKTSRHRESWNSLAVNVANVCQGSAATKAKIVPDANSEGMYEMEACHGSVSLDVTLCGNSVFAQSPRPVLAAHQSWKLHFVSIFNATKLNIKSGDCLRLETIVSFANASCHDHSGYSGSDIDVYGDGTCCEDERHVCSLAMMSEVNVPCDLFRNGQTVILGDPVANITTIGMATFSNYAAFGNHGVETLTASMATPIVRNVSISTIFGVNGMINNFAVLESLPVDCNTDIGDVNIVANSTIDVLQGDEFKDDMYLTYTQSDWGAFPQGSNAGSLLAFNFSRVYPSGWVMIGAAAPGLSAKFNLAGIGNFLPATEPAGVFTVNLVNPMSTSAGSLAGETLALQLSVDFNNAGVTGNGTPTLGNLVYNPAVLGDSLKGQTIAQILVLANQVLSSQTDALPRDYTLARLNTLVMNINNSFVGSTVSAWALSNLTLASA